MISGPSARSCAVFGVLCHKLGWYIAEARIALSFTIRIISEKAAFVDRHFGIRYRHLEMDVLEHCATNRIFIANILARLDHVADLQTRFVCDRAAC
jgi:hypothetical protein